MKLRIMTSNNKEENKEEEKEEEEYCRRNTQTATVTVGGPTNSRSSDWINTGEHIIMKQAVKGSCRPQHTDMLRCV